MAEESQQQIQFRWIEETYGGTFVFRGDPPETADSLQTKSEKLKHIGTFWCVHCVGVYFPIDDMRCFAAHIYVSPPDGFAFEYGLRPPYGVSPSVGHRIERTTFERLSFLAIQGQWQTIHPRFADLIVIVCGAYSEEAVNDGELWHQSGWHVVRGIKQFLAHQASKLMERLQDRVQAQDRAQAINLLLRTMEVDEDAQGFVVEHSTGSVTKFQADVDDIQQDRLPADMGHFSPQGETDFWDGAWRIVLINP